MSDTKKHIVLFDMDGTLTLPRQSISWTMVQAIRRLTASARVGIVTGSGHDYLLEQCKPLWNELGSCYPADIILLPCNGTQHLEWNNEWHKKFNVDMRQKIGAEKFDKLMGCLIRQQSAYISRNEGAHPLTGHFIAYRESLVNWCPVGRNANDEERSTFIKFDAQNNERENLMNIVNVFLKENKVDNIKVSMGGSTSLDIFPTGWDKSFALQHFPDNVLWFVGDRCQGSGNDREIYDTLSKQGKAFETTCPEKTIQLINDVIIPKIKEKLV